MSNILDKSLADDDYALTREEYYRLRIPEGPRVLPELREKRKEKG